MPPCGGQTAHRDIHDWQTTCMQNTETNSETSAALHGLEVCAFEQTRSKQNGWTLYVTWAFVRVVCACCGLSVPSEVAHARHDRSSLKEIEAILLSPAAPVCSRIVPKREWAGVSSCRTVAGIECADA